MTLIQNASVSWFEAVSRENICLCSREACRRRGDFFRKNGIFPSGVMHYSDRKSSADGRKKVSKISYDIKIFKWNKCHFLEVPETSKSLFGRVGTGNLFQRRSEL
ncbi:hypothetical protein AVEN_162979-1 [Araneus ventricosus]|uniref:Uncharacterized protein n=1 Tax=Araneus ventricosus TaxID=182803 RepID=A0A4Y2C2G2_ARAVE|nr:hypothetical protein AVEN_162979-1 [Araneus ventricosus]